MVLFNNSMSYFDKEAIDILLPKVTTNIHWYNELQQDINENVRLISNAIIYYYLHYDIDKAIYYTEYIKQISLKEYMAFEKLLILILTHIKDDILLHDFSFKKTYDFLNILTTLEMSQYSYLFHDLLNKLTSLYSE